MRGIHGSIGWRIFGAFVVGVFGLPIARGLVWVGLVAVGQLYGHGVVADSWENPSACGVGVDSGVGGGSFLVIACVGGEGGTVYSSIWLLIEEAGMDIFVLLCRGLPCAWWRLVCEIGIWCCLFAQFAFGREA